MNNLPALSVETAVETLAARDDIKDTPEFQVIRGALANKVVSLGTDEAFALRDSDGEIKAFRQNLVLSDSNGGLIQPVYKGPHVISAQGYEKWAEAAGACVIFPKEVIVANQWQPNPHAERDPGNHRILAVHARAVAFMFSSKGVPIVSDWSTIFDTPSYRMIDLLAKAKKFKQAFRLLPNEMGAPKTGDSDTWAGYPFDESTTLWVNTSHDEALSWFSTILNREKKSMDFAQTFAKRNALKHLSGLQKAPGNEWKISVLCWRPVSGNIVKWDATQYAQLQQKVGNLITSNGDDFKSKKPIETHVGRERVSDEKGFETIEAETDPEDQQAPDDKPIDVPHEVKSETVAPVEKPPKKQAKAEPPDPYTEKLMKNYHATKEMFAPEFDDACKRLNVGNIDRETPTPEIADSVMKKINEILDMGAQ